MLRGALQGTYGWRIVQVEMALLEGLAVITLGIRQAEKAFLEKVAAGLSDVCVTLGTCKSILFLVPEGKGDILKAM